jgi:hypothetical protein
MKEHKINKLNLFIKGWYINKDICEDIINLFNNNPQQHCIGTIGTGYNSVKISKKDKESTEMVLPRNHLYFEELTKVINKYKNKFDFCDKHHKSWGISEGTNIQKYLPTQGFHSFHFERHSDNTSIKRHLVFMTYLNTVKKKGETEFYYQKLKIKPETGLTIIWPSDWTHTHRGITSSTEEKYIATGWYSYL